MTPKRLEVARRVARDIPDRAYVNLGIGMPTLVADCLPPDREIVIHSENGILGVGPTATGSRYDRDLINASKDPVTLVPGGCFFSHTDSFAMIRGGHIDLAIMGAFEVSASGDFANWSTGDDRLPAVGGAMDLAVGAREVIVMMMHEARDGRTKLVTELSYPATAYAVVTRVYTELATLEPTGDSFLVTELVGGVTFSEVQARTDAPLLHARELLRHRSSEESLEW